MKKNLYLFLTGALMMGSISQVFAQDTTLTAEIDTSWKRGGIMSLNFNQIALSNWAAGGQNSVSGIAMFSYFTNFNDGVRYWDNTFDFAYGLTQEAKNDPRKTDDKIDLSSKYGKKAKGHWYYSVLAGFKSQFTAGYNYPNDSIAISDFLAPAYITLSLGMDYKPSSNFSFFISPLSGRLILVKDQDLADAGAFGVDPAEYNDLGVQTKEGSTIRMELGALAKVEYMKDIMENVNLKAKVELFSNYIEDPQNVDVNAEVLIAMKVNKYITANVTAQVIYDDNTTIFIDNNDDGIVDEAGPRTQFKEVLGIGLAYKF